MTTIESKTILSIVSSLEKNTDLVARLKNGDLSAILELYDEYYDRIYSFVYYRLNKNHDDAEDVIQEVWLTTIKSAKRFKGQSQPYTWLYGIALNKIREFQRRHRKIIKYTIPDPDLAFNLDKMIDNGLLPDELVEVSETKAIVQKALLSLPEHYQDVLTLKYVEDMSVRDISQILNKSVKAVEGLLARARLQLRNRLIPGEIVANSHRSINRRSEK